MQNPSIQEIKDKHGWKIPQMMDSILELGKWMDDVEGRLIREGKLKIVKGKYVKIAQKPVKPEK
jgi:hypothetical protein